MAEMRSHAKFGEFQQVTLTYERIWFGTLPSTKRTILKLRLYFKIC